MVGIGIDLAPIARIAQLVRRAGATLEHWFTANEVAAARVSDDPAFVFARAFAGKEATGKALGIGLAMMSGRDIEVLQDDELLTVRLAFGPARERAAAMGAHEFAATYQLVGERVGGRAGTHVLVAVIARRET